MPSTSKNAAVDEPDPYGITRLYRASWGRDERAVEFLLAKGANINAQDRNGLTLLHCAVMKDNLPWAQLLLDHGADPNVVDRDGRKTAFDFAVNGGHKLIAELLQANNAKEE